MSSPDTEDLPSPCIGLCQIDPESGVCIGCFRTLEEIANWGSAGSDDKRAVFEQIARRRAGGIVPRAWTGGAS